MVCRIPYACPPTYHTSSGSHGQLFRPCWASSAWHSQRKFLFHNTTPRYGQYLTHAMRPNKAERAVHGCHCSGDTAVRMRKVLALPRRCYVLCDPCTLNWVSDLLFTYVNRCCWCRRCLQRSYHHRRATTEQRSYEFLGDKYV